MAGPTPGPFRAGVAARRTRRKPGVSRASFADASAGRPYYAGLLSAIMSSLPKDRADVPADEMLHVIQIIEAGNGSRERDGAVVEV